MHFENASNCALTAGDVFSDPDPPARKLTHADWARLNAGEAESIPLPTNELLPLEVLGSGKFGTPCERMHAANLRSRAAGLEPLFGGLEEPQPAIASEQPAATSATNKRCTKLLAVELLLVLEDPHAVRISAMGSARSVLGGVCRCRIGVWGVVEVCIGGGVVGGRWSGCTGGSVTGPLRVPLHGCYALVGILRRTMRLAGKLVSLLQGVGVPVRSVRFRLTALYGGLFLVCGAGVLSITYVLVRQATRSTPSIHFPAGSPLFGLVAAAVGHQNAVDRHQLLVSPRSRSR